VGYAAAESFDGFGFVGEGGDGLDEAGELEDFANVAGGVEDFQAAALALEGDEGAHQSADAGAVHLGDAGEIYEDVGRARFGELAQFGAERVIARADDDAAGQVENGDVTRLSRRNLQADDSLSFCRGTERRSAEAPATRRGIPGK
jgi:hypothetical protein